MPPRFGRCASLSIQASPRRKPSPADWASVRLLRCALCARPFGMSEIRAAPDAYYASGAAGARYTVPGIPRHAWGDRMRRLEALGLVTFHYRYQPRVPRAAWGNWTLASRLR